MLQKAADAFASTLTKSRIPDFDVLLGPAYKGIPLAAVTCLQLHAKYNVDKTYCYNRKEKKDVGGAFLVLAEDVVTDFHLLAIHSTARAGPWLVLL
jgi:orotate phosphoribosyltransferase